MWIIKLYILLSKKNFLSEGPSMDLVGFSGHLIEVGLHIWFYLFWALAFGQIQISLYTII